MAPIRTIDAEIAGEAVRLVVSGGPSVPGRTMAEKLTWLRKHGGNLRRMLMLEPRGHAGMHGAMLTEPVSPSSHAGVLSMNAAGFPFVSGEGIIGAITIALERKLIDGVEGDVFVDTPAGTFRATPRAGSTRVEAMAVTGVPSFVHTAGLPLRIGTRNVSVDIAFGGELYAIADSEAIGVPIDMANAAALVRMGRDIRDELRPVDIQGTIFTGAPRATADLRSATVLDGEVLRRSPGVTGTAALMAVLDAMGVLTLGHTFVHEGILGTTLHGHVASRSVAETPASVIPVIEGTASITGFHEFVGD
jgi:proline racemase